MIIDCKAENSNYWNRSKTTLAYFDDIRKYPLLTIEEEQKLLYDAKYGNEHEKEKAKRALVVYNQRFVASVARRFSNKNNLLDLINEANVGLIEAIDNYDLTYNNRFITYAVFWMRKHINDYLITKERSVLPVNAQKVYQYASKGREKFFAKNQRYPTEEELSQFIEDEYGIVIPNKEDLIQYSINSIDASISVSDEDDKNSEDVGDFASQTASNNIEDFIEKDNKKSLINFLLSHLSERDREIVTLFFGIGDKEYTIDTIARMKSLTNERVRQIIKLSINKMQKIKINDL